jgi:tripartite-type tricarboxylate transporter receptor subunit TctC
LTALVSGQVQMMIASLAPALPHVKSGRLRGLAVSSRERSRILPEMPTIAESGYPGFEMVSWHSILAPAKTPTPIITRLHGELVKVLARPDVKERFAGMGLDTVGSTPQALAQHIRSETARFAKVIATAGIKPE